jgi:cell division septal protein FtsQ
MNSNINKKKISFFTNKQFSKYIFIGILSCLFLIYIYHEIIKRNNFYTIIQDISEKYNYQLNNVEINSLQRINKSEVNNIIKQYNKLNVEIFEYKPIGLLFYNNQLFYFSKDGKIIDKYKEKVNNNLIIFYGNQVSSVAYNFLNIINKTETVDIIKEGYYINERRWDVKLENNIVLNLSEINVEESLKNYIKLIKKFNNSDIIKIKSIDLRDSEKAIISFK